MIYGVVYIFYIGWLEPLLDEIHKNKTIVVTPVIDVIDDNTLEFHWGSAKHTSVGGFDWNLQFNWHSIPDRENQRRGSEVSVGGGMAFSLLHYNIGLLLISLRVLFALVVVFNL